MTPKLRKIFDDHIEMVDKHFKLTFLDNEGHCLAETERFRDVTLSDVEVALDKGDTMKALSILAEADINMLEGDYDAAEDADVIETHEGYRIHLKDGNYYAFWDNQSPQQIHRDGSARYILELLLIHTPRPEVLDYLDDRYNEARLS